MLMSSTCSQSLKIWSCNSVYRRMHTMDTGSFGKRRRQLVSQAVSAVDAGGFSICMAVTFSANTQLCKIWQGFACWFECWFQEVTWGIKYFLAGTAVWYSITAVSSHQTFITCHWHRAHTVALIIFEPWRIRVFTGRCPCHEHLQGLHCRSNCHSMCLWVRVLGHDKGGEATKSTKCSCFETSSLWPLSLLYSGWTRFGLAWPVLWACGLWICRCPRAHGLDW